MRLINANTLVLHEFHGENIPPYAILSHTWGDQEVTFQDWKDQRKAATKSGFAKIRCACQQALIEGLEWIWVDTNCIDKTSSAELTEAINSMFAYYQQSKVCFAYLSDVPSSKGLYETSLQRQIRNSRWFTRGWTLQELIAPPNLTLYAADWTRIAGRMEWPMMLILDVTGIDYNYLNDLKPFNHASIAERMSWLAKRTTTRVEDMAYCVLGIFDINMPLLYGEGPKAFTRLQEEIIKKSNDHTIFCWTWTPSVPFDWTSLLAPSPIHFEGAGRFAREEDNSISDEISIFSMTNAGISIKLPVMYSAADNSLPYSYYFVTLLAWPASKDRYNLEPLRDEESKESLCIRVQGNRRGDLLYVGRDPYPPRPVTISKKSSKLFKTRSLIVMDNLSLSGAYRPQWNLFTRHTSHTRHTSQVTFLPVFDTERLQIPLEPTPQEWEECRFGVITLEVKAISPGVSVGVGIFYVWVQRASDGAFGAIREGPKASVSIGIKIERDNLHLFSKISRAPDEGVMEPHGQRKTLRRLKRLVSNSRTLSPNCYCEELQLFTAIEVANNVLEPGRKYYFLRIHHGLRRVPPPPLPPGFTFGEDGCDFASN